VTPLLKGRVYAGLAEVYAIRRQYQEAMRAMGYAYERTFSSLVVRRRRMGFAVKLAVKLLQPI